MILENGDVLLVANRRMFERDETRFFVGKTIACEGPILKAEGYSFVKDLGSGDVVKKEEKRVKVISLDSPGYIVYQLPSVSTLDRVDIVCDDGDAYLTDGSERLLNLSERTHAGHF